MVGLLHLEPIEASVSLPNGQQFTVGGLTPVSAFKIYRLFYSEAGLIFEDALRKISGQSGDQDSSDIYKLFLDLLHTAPSVCAAVIVEGASGDCEDPEELAAGLNLPLSVQASALIAIYNLTFTSEMPPKKFLEIVVATLGKVGPISQALGT